MITQFCDNIIMKAIFLKTIMCSVVRGPWCQSIVIFRFYLGCCPHLGLKLWNLQILYLMNILDEYKYYSVVNKCI